YTYPSAEHAAAAIPKALQMLEEYVRDGITEMEFQSAVQSLGNRYAFSVDTAGKRLGLRLRELLHGRKLDTPDEYRSRLSSMSTEALNGRIRARMALDPMAIV